MPPAALCTAILMSMSMYLCLPQTDEVQERKKKSIIVMNAVWMACHFQHSITGNGIWRANTEIFTLMVSFSWFFSMFALEHLHANIQMTSHIICSRQDTTNL